MTLTNSIRAQRPWEARDSVLREHGVSTEVIASLLADGELGTEDLEYLRERVTRAGVDPMQRAREQDLLNTLDESAPPPAAQTATKKTGVTSAK